MSIHIAPPIESDDGSLCCEYLSDFKERLLHGLHTVADYMREGVRKVVIAIRSIWESVKEIAWDTIMESSFLPLCVGLFMDILETSIGSECVAQPGTRIDSERTTSKKKDIGLPETLVGCKYVAKSDTQIDPERTTAEKKDVAMIETSSKRGGIPESDNLSCNPLPAPVRIDHSRIPETSVEHDRVSQPDFAPMASYTPKFHTTNPVLSHCVVIPNPGCDQYDGKLG